MIEFKKVEQTLFEKIVQATLEGGMSIYIEKDMETLTYNCILGLSGLVGKDNNTIRNVKNLEELSLTIVELMAMNEAKTHPIFGNEK